MSVYDQYDQPFATFGADGNVGQHYERLADRLREVRRQLSRRDALTGAFAREHHSGAALRAAQRLECAIRRLDDPQPVRRRTLRPPGGELPWLVQVVERRADVLETILKSDVGPAAAD
jgi:hypothetical protein